MRVFLATALAATLTLTPVLADEFSETVALAMEAYEAGDIDDAKEELDYAMQLLQEMQGADFSKYMPEAIEGWTREMDNSEVASMVAMFGGGVAAKGVYTNGTDTFEIQMMADNSLVASMGMMFGNAATMAMLGEVVRIKREKFVFTDGDTQGLVGGVLFQISGDAPREAIIATLENADFKAIEDY